MRKTLFISHATPEDNDLVIWLTARLQLLGYDVWIDKNALLGGEKFWEEIDQVIRNKAIKFLLVYSRNICINKTPGRLKDGIYKEFSLAESVSKQESLKDFITELNIDNAPHNLFIGADRLTQIPFYENWAEGLKALLKKLEKDEVFKSGERTVAGFSQWYENEYTTKKGIIPKRELYYSNWWPIPKLPNHFYLYRFETEKQAQDVYERNQEFPIIKSGNILTTFDPDLSLILNYDGQEFTIKPKDVHKIKIRDVPLGYESSDFPSHKEAENYLKRILHRVFHLIMKNSGLFWYELANKRQAYFYPQKKKISFEYPLREERRRKKLKDLVGRYLTLGKWHFAISSRAITTHILGYSLKSHIIFTSDGFRVWEDKDHLHTHRRKKGKRLYNDEWRDMLFAFLHGLKKNGKIQIPLNKEFVLEMPLQTELLWSDFGYFDPNDKSRQEVLNPYEELYEEGYEQE